MPKQIEMTKVIYCSDPYAQSSNQYFEKKTLGLVLVPLQSVVDAVYGPPPKEESQNDNN
jgi:hypothetical protein